MEEKNVKGKKLTKKTSCKCKASGETGKCACTKNNTTQKETVILFKCDIGFGNTLFIRGENAPLSWDKGIALQYCDKKQCWVFKTELKQPVEVKVLINDEHWSEGENFTLKPEISQTFEPKFV